MGSEYILTGLPLESWTSKCFKTFSSKNTKKAKLRPPMMPSRRHSPPKHRRPGRTRSWMKSSGHCSGRFQLGNTPCGPMISRRLGKPTFLSPTTCRRCRKPSTLDPSRTATWPWRSPIPGRKATAGVTAHTTWFLHLCGQRTVLDHLGPRNGPRRLPCRKPLHWNSARLMDIHGIEMDLDGMIRGH